ncbi:MAG: ATP-binding protein [Actinomycetota bacterium]
MDTARKAETLTEEPLIEAIADITSALDLSEVLARTFAGVRSIARPSGIGIQLVQDGMLVSTASDPPSTEDAPIVHIPIGEGMTGIVAADNEPLYIPDISRDPRVHANGARSARTYLVLPLSRAGEVIGVMQLDSHREDAFSPQERAHLLSLAPVVAAAIGTAQAIERQRVDLERQAEQLTRDFLSVVRHELRTPLTSITGFGFTLAQQADRLDSATVAEIGRRIRRAGGRLERMITDMIDVTQIDHGTMTVAIEPVAVDLILREAADEQGDEEHPVSVTVESDLPRAMADALHLHQIVANLLGNARKFSPTGSPISLRAFLDEDAIVIQVTDRGVGIPQDLQERIFERFFRIGSQSRGLGVGLYLARQQCAGMGATIGVHSRPGNGATFTLRLRREH